MSIKRLVVLLSITALLSSSFLYWRIRQARTETTSVAANSGRQEPPPSIPATPAGQAKAETPLWQSVVQASGQDKLFDLTGTGPLGQLRQGDPVRLPLPGGREVHGVINLIRTEANGAIHVSGGLTDDKGSFSLATADGRMGGRILLREQARAYLVSTPVAGKLQLRELPLANVICYPLKRDSAKQAAAIASSAKPQAAPPILRSRPDASVVLYLDFDGATVTDPDWDPDPSNPNDNTIVAAPSTLQPSEITQVWNRVKEDYAPFQINVTTAESDYTNAPVGQRMRVIITPTDAAEPGVGGVAYVDSLTRAGAAAGYGFTEDVPAWVFNTTVDGVAEAISHELGHTLGLSHDGRTTPNEDYYEGHGSGPESWAPIMGAGYYCNIVQWSKGEYPNANNFEDDVAIISGSQPTPLTGATNPTGYWSDEAGNTRATAANWALTEDKAGMITTASDVDFYTIVLPEAYYFVINGTSADDQYRQPNLNLILEIQDSSGNVLATGNPNDTPSASVSATLPAGTYYLKVAGTGHAAVGTDYGFSNYGSIGRYNLHSYGYTAKPVITSPTTATVGVGQPFSYQIIYQSSAGGDITGYGATNLPSGLTLNTTTGLITGKPSSIGVSTIQVSVSNAYATGTATLTLTVTDAAPGVTNQTGRQTLVPGANTTLTVNGFSANGTITYQWVHDGRPVNGATTNTLPLTNATRSDNGAYWVEMTNSIGTSRSQPIFVRVAPASTQVLGWGENGYDLLAIPNGLNNAVNVALPMSSAAPQAFVIQSDGSLVTWGNNHTSGYFNLPAGLNDIVKIGSGFSTPYALRSDGTVVRWDGSGIYPIATNVFDLSVGQFHALALKTDGTVLALPVDSSTTAIVPPAGLTNVVAVAAGGQNTSMALKRDGTVVTWGPSIGALTPPAGLNNVVAIGRGLSNFLAIKSDGTVVAWNSNGLLTVPAEATNIVAVAGGNSHTIALKTDGTVVAWGNSAVAPPPGLTGVFDIAAGANNTFVIRDAAADSAPSITMPPVSLVRAERQNAVFTITASGATPLYYQWRKNGNDIPGATTPTLSLTNLVPNDSGNYDVVVHNYLGTVTSTAASLVVHPLPVVTPTSTRQVGAPGESLTLTVTASGMGTLHYRWIHNGQTINTATAGSLALNSLGPVDGGWYAVEVTDDYGSRLSSPIFVIVAPAQTQVVFWGSNYDGVGEIPAGLNSVVKIASGRGTTAAALKRNGQVVAWGNNFQGQANVPADLANVVDIAVGTVHMLALRSDGTVAAWGNGSASQLNIPPGLTDVVSIAAGDQLSLALKSDGTVVAWGTTYSGLSTVPAGLNSVAEITAGGFFALALKSDGTVTAWGRPDEGATTIPGGLANVVEISGGGVHALALRSDGTVIGWGSNGNNAITIPAGLNGVSAISAGQRHSLALKSDGTVVAWGDNSNGQSSPPSDLNGVVAIATGLSYSLALRDAFTDPGPVINTPPISLTVGEGAKGVFSVEATGPGSLAYQWRKNGTNIPGATSSILTLRNVTFADAATYDVVVTNYIGSTTSAGAMLTVKPAPNVTSVSAPRQLIEPGAPLNLQVTATGTGTLHYQWIRNGRNIDGATGNGYAVAGTSTADSGWYVALITDDFGTRRSSPIFVTVAPSATQIRAWGYSDYGVTSVPNDLTDAIALSSSDHHALALKRDGTVIAWGYNGAGECNVPAGLSDVVAVSAGGYHSLALKSDGTVVAWGQNYAGSLDIPSGLNNIVAIAGGDAFSLALKNDGTVVAWGRPYEGQTAVPVGLENVMQIATMEWTSLALKDDGSIVSWPPGTSLFSPPAGVSDIREITPGVGRMLVRLGNGTVAAWGTSNDFGQATVLAGLNNVARLAVGAAHNLALKTDGTIVAWGNNEYGQSTVPVGLSKVFAIAAGQTHSLTLAAAPSANQPPTASFSLSSERTVGQTVTIDLNLGDPDGNYAYANLWVHSPTRGWLAIKPDNSTVYSVQLLSANSVAPAAGHYTRSFTLSDGPGQYTFALSAVDAAGLRTDVSDQVITVTVPNQPPTASFSLSSERTVGQTVTIDLNLGDPDGNYAYANLWVHSPTRGWLAIKPDNSTVYSVQLLSANSVAPAAGHYTRSFTLSDGPGQYTFALSAVDAAGLRTDVSDQVITVTVPNQPPTASFSLSSERTVGQTVTIDLNLGDPDGNYAYANLWVHSPTRGWLAIKPDNSTVYSVQLLSANSVAPAAGHYTRSFTLSDGPGQYTFALSAVDAAGLRTDVSDQVITVTVASGAATEPVPTLIYADDFDGDLSDWVQQTDDAHGTSYWIAADGLLTGYYPSSLNASSNTHSFLLLADAYQPSGDWDASVEFAWSENQSIADFGLWLSDSAKLSISAYSTSSSVQSTITVAVRYWDGAWHDEATAIPALSWIPSNWNVATLQKRGQVYHLLVNGTELFHYTDTKLNGFGKLGLHAYGSQSLDNFLLEAL